MFPQYSRTRDEHDGRDKFFHFRSTNRTTGALVDDSYYQTHFWTKLGYISDRVNPKRRDGTRAPGPVYHHRIERQHVAGYDSWYNPQYDQDVVSSGYNASVTTSDIEGFLPSIPRGYILEQCLAALKKFTTQIPEEVSIANFIYELKDFKDIVPKVNKLRDFPGAANSSFLGYNFAWAPLIGDLSKLLYFYESITKRLDFLRRTAGKPIRVYYSKPDFWPGPSEFLTSRVVGTPSERIEFMSKGYSSQFTSSVTIVQDLDLDGVWTKWVAALAGLGLNNPAKIVWNAIPFSFVIDWVLPVNDFLDLASANLFKGTWYTTDWSTSVKQSISVELYRAFYLQVNPKTLLDKFKATQYSRVEGLPLTAHDLTLLDLDTKEQALLTSLILTKILPQSKKKR